MKTLQEVLKPRDSVFVDTTRDDVLNLTDLAEGRVNGKKFFSENFETQGMRMLIDNAFKRFAGKNDTGVIRLTQAMGGGKTHSMLALALLAEDVTLREDVLGDKWNSIGKVKVISFSGRENAPFGIWGALAEQLGKKEQFNSFYSPLSAPGETAWIRLLEGQKTLILLDELPPYLENAKSIKVGDSNLCVVTTTALANLFNALGKSQLADVCLVFSDLKAAYESGSEMLQSSFKELDSEASRVAFDITPVSLNSDEIYSILKKRLFEDHPLTANLNVDVNEIANAYKEAVDKANKTDLTGYTGEAVYTGIKDSYPFHPSIKDLYARFKENQNFQQTRGLIKLMRQIVRQIWETGLAKNASLINVYDVDLNSQDMAAQFRNIKPALDPAVSHDIAEMGHSAAELIDKRRNDHKDYAQRAAKLLMVSSLSTVPNGMLGLTIQETIGYLVDPSSDIGVMKDAVQKLIDECWYLKTDNRGRLYFQNTKNLVAQVKSLVESYSKEDARKELRDIMRQIFGPTLKTCYQKLYPFPAIDEIELSENQISLVVFEPYPGSDLHPDLKKFYDNATFKNRVMFLSGDRAMMDNLYENAKAKKAAELIMTDMRAQHVASSDQQYKEAESYLNKMEFILLSAIRETFVTLWFPIRDGNLAHEDISLEFKAKARTEDSEKKTIDGELQIIDALIRRKKYEAFSRDDQFLETMRKKCEARIFTRDEIRTTELTSRAATETAWGWYHPDQMNTLIQDCKKKNKWRENGGYYDRSEIPEPPTSVSVSQVSYDRTSHEFTLSVRGNGGTVFYDIGSDPTEASQKLETATFKTSDPETRFICIDLTGERKTGDVVNFLGKPDLRYEARRGSDGGRLLRFETHPKYEVRYSTDGSEPKENGAVYSHGSEEPVPNEKFVLQALLLYKGAEISGSRIQANIEQDEKEFKVIPDKPLDYTLSTPKETSGTSETYDTLSEFDKIPNLLLSGIEATVFVKKDTSKYVNLSCSVQMSAGDVEALIDLIRDTNFKDVDVETTFTYSGMHFDRGDRFQAWVDRTQRDINRMRKEGTVKQ